MTNAGCSVRPLTAAEMHVPAATNTNSFDGVGDAIRRLIAALHRVRLTPVARFGSAERRAMVADECAILRDCCGVAAVGFGFDFRSRSVADIARMQSACGPMSASVHCHV